MYMYIQYIESLLLITNPIAIYKTLFKYYKYLGIEYNKKFMNTLKFKVVFLMLVINYKLVEA